MKWVAALVGVLVFASSAQAATVVDGAARYQQWADRAQVPTPDIGVNVIDAPCPAYGSEAWACTYEAERTIYIRSDAPRPRRMFFHELGHLFDYYVMTDQARVDFLAIRRDTREWEGAWDSPSELFATGYAFCAMQPRPRRPDAWQYGYWIGLGKHRAVCDLIRATWASRDSAEST